MAEAINNLLAEQEIARSSASNSVEVYLNHPNTKRERLVEHNHLIGETMSSDCIAAIVIPAHNEAENIPPLLEALANQTFNPESGISANNFEIILIDNNSTDGTANIAKQWLKENQERMKIKVRVVSVQFDENEKGVGAARKLGADLALLRAFERPDKSTDEFYILGLDADNPGIPTDHLEKYVHAFRETKADALAGGIEMDTYNLPDGSIFHTLYQISQEYQKNRPKLPAVTRKHTSGANHGVTADTYIRIGGYPRSKVGEDVWIGLETKKIGGTMANVDSNIKINPRRVLIDPIVYLKGGAWEEERFVANNDSIRRGDQFDERNLTDDSVRSLLESWLVGLAYARVKSSEQPVGQLIHQEFDAFRDFAAGRLKEEYLPEESSFRIIDIDRLLERGATTIEKQKLIFKQSLTELASKSQGLDLQLCGRTAAWLLDNNLPLPGLLVPNVLVNLDNLPKVVESFGQQGYRLCHLDSWSISSPIAKEIAEPSKQVVGQRNIVFISDNPEKNPPVFAVQVVEKTPDGSKLSSTDIITYPISGTPVEIDGISTTTTNRVGLMTMLATDSAVAASLETIYQNSSSTEKNDLNIFLIDKSVKLYSFLTERIIPLFGQTQEYQREVIMQTIQDIIGPVIDKETEEKQKYAVRILLDVLEGNSASKTLNKLKSVALAHCIPTFLQSTLAVEANEKMENVENVKI